MARYYLVAGEASGDMLGAVMMRALRDLDESAHFDGVGGEKMEAEGLASLFPYHELSLMGFAEVVPHMLRLMARIDLVVEDVSLKRPDVVVTIDSPGFNFRVAAKLRKQGYKGRLVHYVAPSVWAYKPERAEKCAKLFDRLLCLLPFEPPYFEAAGLQATFVGHPVAYQPRGDGAAFRERFRLPPEAKLVTMLPGSRENEIHRHMEVFATAVTMLATVHPDLALVVPVSQRLLPLMSDYFQGCPFRAVLVAGEEDKRNAFAASTVALVKSGTVSLEVAQAGVAQVVGYRAHPVSVWIARRMITIQYINILNIMANKVIIPEFVQESCTANALGDALGALFADSALREAQCAQAAEQLALLRLPEEQTPGMAAAAAVREMLEV